jgi:hypothetical protein
MDLDGMETDIGDDMNSTVRSAGDVNKDGSIDSLDATKILINYAKYLNNGGKKPSTGDTNGDGIADSRDATAILIYYAEQLLEEAGNVTSHSYMTYPKTVTSNFENKNIARVGSLDSIYKVNLDNDSAVETVLKYTQTGYKPFFMIYDDNNKPIKNTTYTWSDTNIFADFGNSYGVSYYFAVIKTSDGKYRATYESEKYATMYTTASWTDVLRSTEIITATYESGSKYYLYGKSSTYNKVKTEFDSFRYLVWSSDVKSIFTKTLSYIKR